MAAGLSRAEAVTAYLAETEGDPFGPGDLHCCGWAAGWVLRLTGRDPMARWRGRYAGAAEAMADLGQGGLPAAFLAGCRSARLVAVAAPVWGDVALVETPEGPAAAVRAGAHWIGKIDGGLAWHDAARLPMGVR